MIHVCQTPGPVVFYFSVSFPTRAISELTGQKPLNLGDQGKKVIVFCFGESGVRPENLHFFLTADTADPGIVL